jgi:hypothetical protein
MPQGDVTALLTAAPSGLRWQSPEVNSLRRSFGEGTDLSARKAFALLAPLLVTLLCVRLNMPVALTVTSLLASLACLGLIVRDRRKLSYVWFDDATFHCFSRHLPPAARSHKLQYAVCDMERFEAYFDQRPQAEHQILIVARDGSKNLLPLCLGRGHEVNNEEGKTIGYTPSEVPYEHAEFIAQDLNMLLEAARASKTPYR